MQFTNDKRISCSEWGYFREFWCHQGFSLIELLVVMAIIITMSVFVAPVMQSLSGAGAVNRAIGDVTGALEQARAYAMAHRTYVRVALAQVPKVPGEALPGTAVLVLYSADGTLENATAAAMQDATLWPALARPIVVRRIVMDETLQGTAPDTSADLRPSGTDIPAFSRHTPGVSGALTFEACIQFNPNGEAGVLAGGLANQIALGMDESVGGDAVRGTNPFIIRLSGVNGAISVLRKGEGI